MPTSLSGPTGPGTLQVSSPGARAVLVTRDPHLEGEAARLAAGAGCPLEVCHDVATLRREWHRCRAVLVGSEVLDELTSATLPRRPEVHVLGGRRLDAVELRLALELGADGVLELPGDAARVAAVLADLTDDDVRPGTVVGVVGVAGGVGSSVLTVSLTSVASERTTALAVDLDPRGAGLELIAGDAEDKAPSWDSLRSAHGRLNGQALRSALATGGSAAVLGWGSGGSRVMPPTSVVAESLAAARRGHEWTFVDSRSAEVWAGCDALVVVVAGSVPGVATALRTARDLPSGLPVGVAVRSRRHDRWAHQVAQSLELPLWAVVTQQRSLDLHLSAGLGPVRQGRSALRRAAVDVLRELSQR